MFQRAGSRGDLGKAPMYAISHMDDSSDDEHVAQVLQSHFNCVDDDPRPISSIPMETWFRRRCSVERASVSSELCTISSGASSQRRPTRGKGTSRGEIRAKHLIIDIDADFFREEVLLDFGARRCSLRLRLLPH